MSAAAPRPAPRDDFDPPLADCPLCDGRLQPYDHDHHGRRIGRCADCRVLLMNPQYSQAHLHRFYSSYISVDDQDREGGSHFRQPAVRREAKRRSLSLLAEHIAPGRLLSIGCGDGLELDVAQELGWTPEGYDIDPATTAEVEARFGVPVHDGDLEQLDRPDGWFDAVFMDQVLEHLTDPGSYLQAAHRLLRPDGLLFVGVPNIGSVANRLKTTVARAGLRARRRGNHYHTKHHIFYFTPTVLRHTLIRHGFEVLLLRGSLKPNRKPLTVALSRWLPSLDSGMIALARRVAPAAPDA